MEIPMENFPVLQLLAQPSLAVRVGASSQQILRGGARSVRPPSSMHRAG